MTRGEFYSLGGVPVAVVEAEGEMVAVRRKWGATFKVPATDLTPIPLTPFYLVTALHFAFVDVHQMVLERRIGGHHHVIVQTALNTWCLITDGTPNEMPMTYVHQVQICSAGCRVQGAGLGAG